MEVKIRPVIREEKRCSKCKITKSLNEFHHDKKNRDGHRPHCKTCGRKTSHRYYEVNCGNRRKKTRCYYKMNPGKCREATRQWKKKNIERCREKQHLYHKLNNGKIREGVLLWRKTHQDKIREYNRFTSHKRYNIPQNRLSTNVATRIRQSLHGNKKGNHWETLVDYTIEQLKKHLEKRFLIGMNWENYGDWHIDHIIPISVFNYEKPEDIDFKRCWSLENLQPLWAKDNHNKKDKLEKPFQPSLIM